MAQIRLCILVSDGTRVLVNPARGHDLPSIDVEIGDTREDETILEAAGPALTGLSIGGYSFLDSIYVRRAGETIVNLYLANSIAGAFPVDAPAGRAWATIGELERSAMPDGVLASLQAMLAGMAPAADSADALRAAWDSMPPGGPGIGEGGGR